MGQDMGLAESCSFAECSLSTSSQVFALFNSGHKDTGVLAADCATIHWADKSIWYHDVVPVAELIGRMSDEFRNAIQTQAKALEIYR